MNVAVRPLNLISLCTGGGGLDLGIELAVPSARSVVCVEREAFAVTNLVAAMQQGLVHEAPIWSDVTTFNGRPWRGLVDGVVGGIPCQPHSVAGLRLAEEDERDLWSAARRIIVQSRPWFFFIENVGGFVTSGGLERLWRNVRRLGYEPEIGLFTASEVGASHRRERCFVLCVADARCAGLEGSERRSAFGERHGPAAPGSTTELRGAPLVHAERAERGARVERQHIADRDAAGRQEAASRVGESGSALARRRAGDERQSAAAVADPDLAVILGESSARQFAHLQYHDGLGGFAPGPSDAAGWLRALEIAPHLEPAVCRMADGLAARVDLSGPHAARIERLRMLGNGVVPLEAAYAFRTLATRLSRRSARAAQLVRLMEIAS